MLTEDTSSIPDFDRIMANFRAAEERAAALIPINKRSLFTALAATGLTRVIVRFDGYGDSGQIEELDALIGAQPGELPTEPIMFLQVDHASEEPVERALTPTEAIERLCYDLLARTHGGWENNGGAFGEFTFDIASSSIALDFNLRIETSEHFGHSF